MPNSYKDFTASSGTTSVNFTSSDFEYLDTAHLKVVVTTASDISTEFLQTDTGQNGSSAPFSVSVLSGTTTITFDNMNGVTGNGLPANTAKVRIQRTTPSSSLLTTFQDASLLRASDLNDNAKQLLFVLQEQVDAGTGSLPLNAAGFFDAGTKRIGNMADGVGETDAATFGQLSAFSAFSTDTPTVPQFKSYAGSEGTFSSPNTTYPLGFTPLSTIDATFICEVGGVVQVPSSDFTVTGTDLVILGRDTTTVDKIVLQAFGVTKSVFEFPITAQASTNTEIPLTLKGANNGNGAAVLMVRTSDNGLGGAITANGIVKVKGVQPLGGDTLDVDATNITTTGTITSGGNLTVGSASITQSTGDATFNNINISSSTQGDGQAVPKSYVNAFGGSEGQAIGPATDLDTITTPGLYTGTVPGSPSSYNYPATAAESELFSLRVTRTGGTSGTGRVQVLSNSNDNIQSVRSFNGSAFSSWTKEIRETDTINSLAVPTSALNMNNQKITNVAAATQPNDVVTLSALADTIGAQVQAQTMNVNMQTSLISSATASEAMPFNSEVILPYEATFTPRNNSNTPDYESARLGLVQPNISMVSLADASNPFTTLFGASTDKHLLKIPAHSGPLNVDFVLSKTGYSDSGPFEFKVYEVANENATSATLLKSRTISGSGPFNPPFPVSKTTLTTMGSQTVDKYMCVTCKLTDSSGTDQLAGGLITITRGQDDTYPINDPITYRANS